MQQKLNRGEYRTALAMQKDFVLIMSNCLQFNSANSEIVREARQQTLQRPSLLKKAAIENNLFLAEDGSAIEVYSDCENEDEDIVGNDVKKIIPQKPRRGKKKGLPPKVKGKNNRKKLVRCKTCDPCQREDCGDCEPCQDKKKFGGTGTLKQSCVHRNCKNLREEKAKRGRPRKKLASDRESEESDNNERSPTPKASLSDGEKSRNDVGETNSQEKRRPRIRIKLSGSSSSKVEEKDLMDRIPKKRRKVEVDTSGPDYNSLSDGEIDEGSNICAREKGHVEETPEECTEGLKGARVASGENDTTEDEDESIKSLGSDDVVVRNNNEPVVEPDNDSGSIYMDIEAIRDEHANLDGSLLSARSKFIAHGPWCIPKAVGEDKFKEVAKATIDKICRYDEYKLFAESVNETDAPGYYDIVTQPMDFGTMRCKLEKGKYKAGSKGIMGVYHDFLLVMDNCALYNENNEQVLNEAGRLLSLLPETFAVACVAVAGKLKRKISKVR